MGAGRLSEVTWSVQVRYHNRQQATISDIAACRYTRLRFGVCPSQRIAGDCGCFLNNNMACQKSCGPAEKQRRRVGLKDEFESMEQAKREIWEFVEVFHNPDALVAIQTRSTSKPAVDSNQAARGAVYPSVTNDPAQY